MDSVAQVGTRTESILFPDLVAELQRLAREVHARWDVESESP